MRNRLMIVALVLVAVCGLALVCSSGIRANSGRFVFADKEYTAAINARWSPDGKSIYYAMGYHPDRLYTYILATGNTSYRLFPSAAVSGVTSISPDGKSATVEVYKGKNRIFRVFDDRQRSWRSIPFLKNADDVLWLKPDTLLVFKSVESQQRAFTIRLSDDAKPVMLASGSKPLLTGVESGRIEGYDRRAIPSYDGCAFAYIDKKGMPHVYDLLSKRDLALKLHPAMKPDKPGTFHFLYLTKDQVVYFQWQGGFDSPVCVTDLPSMKSRLLPGFKTFHTNQISPDFKNFWRITNMPLMEHDVDPPTMYLYDLSK